MEVPELLLQSASEVAKSMLIEFEFYKNSKNFDKLHDFKFGFANAKGNLSKDGPPFYHHPDAPFKYLSHAYKHASKNIPYIKFLESLNKEKKLRVYEIGVGPGYLMYMSRHFLQIPFSGCDIDIDTLEVYGRIRQKLGVDQFVEEQCVKYNIPLHVNNGSNTVIAMWTVFNKKWGVKEHLWFWHQCHAKLQGESKWLIIRFNNQGYFDKPQVVQLYTLFGTFPIENDKNFCVVDLTIFD